jgi:hypothetical protein
VVSAAIGSSKRKPRLKHGRRYEVSPDSVSKPPLCPALTNGIALPVSQTGFARDNGRTFGNVGSIGDQTASGVTPKTPAMLSWLAPRLLNA